ncbi:hypothetical protein CC99x_006940 [Candidatus Berkiella cookevillensis]|uniref:Uncharacterized protein n=1 Tax=Candidatus Berkiella cookevillensis TaxID=437022 RepID=A0A0Q9YMZ2_9GAMM|nr:hypothetical protein [Candidatus Berkiella cookevillensis]MCS5708642.1 hypothetical protein [Candidatus Berkiella cookevillensis]
MKDQKNINSPKKPQLTDSHNRVLARLISRKLTSEEVQRISAGKADCVYTSYPRADVECNI